MSRSLFALQLLSSSLPAVLLSGLTGCAPPLAGDLPVPDSRASQASDSRIESGPLTLRTVLSGVAEAAEVAELVVPDVGVYPIQVRRLLENGTEVHAGDIVAELDNSSLVTNLAQLEDNVVQAETQLITTEAQAAAELEQALFELQQKQAEYDKAVLAATVPEQLRSAREYEQLVLARDKAALELEQARRTAESKRISGASSVAAEQVALDKALLAWERAQTGIDRVVLRAPRDGIVQLGENHQEDRIMQEGDSIFPGWTIAGLPDLNSLRVRARLFDVDDGAVAPGWRAKVVFDAFPDRELAGTVRHVDPVAHQRGRRSTARAFSVLVSVDERADDGSLPLPLLPGMSARVTIEQEIGSSTTGSAETLVPRAALVWSTDPGGLPAASVVSRQGERSPVELGLCSSAWCQLLAGPPAGTLLRAATELEP